MWNGRRNRLLICWSASLLTVSFVSLWMGHALLLLDTSHDAHFFLLKDSTKSSTPTFWNRISREIQNRTAAAKNKCRERHQLLRHRDRGGGGFVSNYDNQCRYPPRHECEMEKYSIVFHVQEQQQQQRVRTLFINILKSLALPRVTSIHVVLEKGIMASLQRDVKYGHRILNWHENHKITIHVGLPEFHGHEALLLFNGDIPHVVGNRRGLELGFQLWKRNANALVARRTWSLKKKKKKKKPSNTFHNVSTHESFVTVCNNESLELSTTTTIMTTNQQQDGQHDASLVDPSGLWIHSDFLCIAKPFLIETKHYSWWTRLIVVLMQVAQGPIHLYPAARLPISTNEGLTIQDDSVWIDLQVLNGLVHEFGGIPALQRITWCAEHHTTTGEQQPRLCDPTSISIAAEYDFTTFQC